MKISQYIELLSAKVYVNGDEREILSGYCGDFLSFVMGKAPADCAWFTIMNNINVAAVATLADVGMVILCENVVPDEALVKKMELNDITLISTELTTYEAVLKINGVE